MSSADVVALVNQQGKRTAIWHVVIDPAWPMSRLSGAWVDVVAPAMYAQRYLLPVGERIPANLAYLAAEDAGVVEPNATRDAIAAVIDQLTAQHLDNPTKAGKPRAPISWPQLPEHLDWTRLPNPPNGVADDPLTSETIALARWLSRLADAWSNTETIRLSRDYLSGDDSVPRRMPVVLRK